MRVDELMNQHIQTCRPEDSLQHAAQLMWDHDCGCVPVCSGDGVQRTIGVITDRDICMGALFQAKPLQELRVGDAMARQLLACRPQDSLKEAEQAMRDARIRRLPVLDDHGALLGMLSLADLAREAAREQTQAHREVTEVEVNDTLAAICQPTRQSLPA